ncbi:hypothetical protein LCGC14_0767670 [marine sediment metagenome]|uniref:Phosphoadenosine phosphosulphate reductase domain-containing protein n=1 Tax=marine sediment metagenome TaxID=412755 RepID=A0A0F9QJ07_9ZZZZ
MGIEQLTYIDNTKIIDTVMLPPATYQDKIDVAIALLQAWEPPGGFFFADSGGKDSCLTMDLLDKAKSKYDAHYAVSPIDPPQIYDFLKECHPDTQWDIHAKNFWGSVLDKGLPMRNQRWCCQIIKEAGGDGRIVVTGNRRAEGNIRRNQCYVEVGRRKKSNKTFLRPILNFDDNDVWRYIRENNIPYCSLYDEGATRKGYGEGYFKRLGCVLCPFSRNIKREEYYFPKIVANWKRVCGRLNDKSEAKGWLDAKGEPLKHIFKTPDKRYDWWVARDRARHRKDPRQLEFDSH